MKRISILLLFAISVAACQKKTPSTGTFGDAKMTAEGAVPVQQFVSQMGLEPEKTGKISGTVTSVCQGEGCWLNMDLGDGKYVHIETKDHSFSLPKDAKGKSGIAEGTLRRNATEKGNGYEFEATGVIIQ